MRAEAGLAFAFGLFISPAFAEKAVMSDAQLDSVTAGTDFEVTKLVADQPGIAPTTDPDLVNPWGLSQAPGGPLWVANNGTGTSTLYNKDTGAKIPLTVNILGPTGSPAAPTGTVFNTVFGSADTDDFVLNAKGKSGQSAFLFATEDGTIAAWAPKVDLNNAFTVVDRSAQGAVFKGLATGVFQGHDRIYAADFANNRVRIYDFKFRPVGSFTDPTLPADYAPFNVQNLNGKLYVAFAKREAGGIDEVAGRGNGFVDTFDTDGHFLQRVVSQGKLNAPWGLTIAPKSFGKFAGALLVGNFGDGTINAYDPHSGEFLGRLRDDGKAIKIDGLWALHNGPNGTVFFTAGTNGEKNGLLGTVGPEWSFEANFGRAVTLAKLTTNVGPMAMSSGPAFMHH